MAGSDILCYCISLLTAGWLAHLFPTSSVQDRPVNFIVLALAACSFALTGISKALPKLFYLPESAPYDYTALSLDDLGHGNVQEDAADTPSTGSRHDSKVRISVLVAAVCALSVRIELYRRISGATECTIDSVEVFLPFLLAVYDAVRSQRPWKNQEEERPDSTVYDSLIGTWRAYILRPRTRYLLSIFLVSYGCYRIQSLWTPLNSTYICPTSTGERRTIPAIQFSALVLDLFLALIVYETSPKKNGKGLSGRRCVVLWSTVTIATAIVWSSVALVVYIYMPENRASLLLSILGPFSDFRNLMATAGHVLLFCLLCISSLHCIIIYGVVDMSLHLAALMTMIPSVEFIWSHKSPFPPIPAFTTTLSFFVAFLGRWSYRRIQQALGEAGIVRPSRQTLLFLSLCILLFPAWFKKDRVFFHPIDLLIYDANLHHAEYLKTLGNTTSLADTVARYKQKYNRNPPPGFDVWFEYAKNKSAIVVDEFDQIYEDLLPFRAVSPGDLRRATWEMISNPWNEISGITIRNGKASVQEKVLPTHRWMLEGVSVLINSFAQHLPDLDLAFNLNDESRVAVPYDAIKYLREKGRELDKSGRSSWSNDRAASWPGMPDHEVTGSFHDMSFRNTFREFGSVGCRPSSLARRSPHISSHAHICSFCVFPHSLGQFVANWSEAADVCHQPDMAHLHGFYLSPAAFKATHELLPVFSQSKPHGFNDILYPSAWNYMDKVRYAPTEAKGTAGQDDYDSGFPDLPFEQKENVLFWRGATSEGVSSENGAWRGMTRQRLVHMANNLPTSPHERFTILLPVPGDHTRYQYRVLPGPAAKELGLKTDIAIVDRIARCGGADCRDQEAEFNLVAPTDFQAHWRYRFLFDLDGAGFSGRFLPFLQSRSLPFKTALFREWYDSRLTAWLHFVPQDIRLHDVWSTLAYFGGVNGTMFGQRIWWRPHLREGEIIAEAGRKWAAKVLRKEDMEVYFFRLLLEWGRLTDDNRDELGFDV